MNDIVGRNINDDYITHLNTYMPQYGIITNPRIQFFIAIACGETGGFSKINEIMNYSKAGIEKTFSNKFHHNENINDYVMKDKKLANKVYGGIYKNGQITPTHSSELDNDYYQNSDGWKYRGGGIFQLTFKCNYEDYADNIGIGKTRVEELITSGNANCVREIQGAVRSACYYAQNHNKNGSTVLLEADKNTWESFINACRIVGRCPDGNNYQKKRDYLAKCRAYIGGDGIVRYDTGSRVENTRLTYLTSTELNVFLEAKRKMGT